METNRKVIGNAMIAYFLIFICITFFMNKENKYINNDFVKSHTKTAFLLHISFLLVYIIFVSFRLGGGVHILDFSLNTLIASSLFIGIFWILMYGMYRAHRGRVFTLWDILTLTKTENLIGMQEEKEMSEQEKLWIILSYIPFLGFFTYGKNITSVRISEIVQLNLIVSVIIWLLYISGGNNLWIFVTLLYILFVAYCVITLVSKDEVVTVSMKYIPSPTEKYIWIQSLCIYIKNHLHGKDVGDIQSLYEKNKLAYYEAEKKREAEQKTKKDISLPVYLIFIPIINILSLPFVKGKYKYHIISNNLLNIFIIVSIYLFGAKTLVPLLALFPLSFALGYKSRLGYQIPFIYDIYKIVASVCYRITHLFHKTRDIQKTDRKVTMKVGEKTNDSVKGKTQ